MSTEQHTEQRATTRLGFLKAAAAAGAGAPGLGALGPGAAFARRRPHGPTKGDVAILKAAQIAEALAVTTYSNIIGWAPFFTSLESDDQGYLAGGAEGGDIALPARGKPHPQAGGVHAFYSRQKMFTDAQTTLDTLVTLEDAFIAAYLVGVRDFSTADLRVTAARIMGIESDHRGLAQIVCARRRRRGRRAGRVGHGDPGKAERVDPPNNNGYERTLGLTRIEQAVVALPPFADKTAAEKAGFDITKAYRSSRSRRNCPARWVNSTR